MGIRSTIAKFVGHERRSSDPLNNPAIPLSTSGFLAWASGEPTVSGERVTVATSLQQATVYACVRVLSESVASLPVRVYELTDNGRKENQNHDLAYLLGVAPNPEMTAFTFWESLVGGLALTGNCYAEIQRDKGGRPVALWPLHPQKTEPKRTPLLPNGTGGDLVYETSDGLDGKEGNGQTRTIASADILHVPLFCFDGLRGISPVQLARQGIGLARASELSGARFFGNGSKPGGILTTDSEFDDPEIATIKSSWERTNGGDKQGGTAFLPGKWTYTPIGLSNKDSQFLEIRQYQRTEIAAIFRVPPHMVGDTSKLSNANAEQQALTFVTDTLRPYLSRLESEIARKLLPTAGRNSGRFVVEFDVSERLRGDIESQAAGFTAGKQWGWLSTNDIRAEIGMNPIGPAGDIFWVPVNMQNAERLLDTESIQDQPLLSDAKPDEDTTPDTDAAPTPDERSAMTRYTSAYLVIYRDAFGRLCKRDKRDYDTISGLFSPVLRSIAEAAQGAAMSKNGISVMPNSGIDKHIETVCRSMAKRAADYTDTDVDANAGAEFTKAVRSVVINTARDVAAFAAEQTVSETHNE
jgi:HK97 family phage portal protein